MIRVEPDRSSSFDRFCKAAQDIQGLRSKPAHFDQLIESYKQTRKVCLEAIDKYQALLGYEYTREITKIDKLVQQRLVALSQSYTSYFISFLASGTPAAHDPSLPMPRSLVEEMREAVLHKDFTGFEKKIQTCLENLIPIMNVFGNGPAQTLLELNDAFKKEIPSRQVVKLDDQLTPEMAAQNLSAYCALYCPEISFQTAFEMIKEGQSLMRQIMSGMRKPSADIKESEKEMASITWFLQYCALQKKQGFQRGSFVVEEGGKLYAFMFASPGCGERPSSHFVGRSSVNQQLSGYIMKSSSHYGVDVLNGLLPAKKRTLLFGQIEPYFGEEKLLFLKAENYSAFVTTRYGYDALMHSYELMEFLRKKQFQKGTHDLPGMQKDVVPENAKESFQKLINHIQEYHFLYQSILQNLDPKIYNLPVAMSQANLWGIAYMHAFIKGIEEQCPTPLFEVAAAPLKAMMNSLDHPERRTGREVYITAEELNQFVLQEFLKT